MPGSHLEHPTVPGFVLDAFDDGWTAADHARPCELCHRPAYCRDPQGRPRHRIDCLADTQTASTTHDRNDAA